MTKLPDFRFPEHPQFTQRIGEVRKWLSSEGESQFIDYKGGLFLAKRRDGSIKAKFLKHLLAFANTARMTRRKCRFVFGIEDPKTAQKRNSKESDISEPWPQELVSYWEVVRADGEFTDEQFAVFMTEKIGKYFFELGTDFIQPSITNLDKLIWGYVDEKFVVVLELGPQLTKKPFQLKKDFNYRESGKPKSLKSESVYIRAYESSITYIGDLNDLKPYDEATCLSRSDWWRLIEPLHSDVFMEKLNLFNQFPLYCQGDKNALDRTRSYLDEGNKVVGIIGPAGQGKSVLMKALACSTAAHLTRETLTFIDKVGGLPEGQTRLDEENDITLKDFWEVEPIPQSKMPLYISLRGVFASQEDFKRHLLKSIEEALGLIGARERTPGEVDPRIEHYFDIPGSKWLLLLDGGDEIDNLSEVGREIPRWIDALPTNVQVVIAARRYTWEQPISNCVVELQPLKPEGILQLLELRIRDFYRTSGDFTLPELEASIRRLHYWLNETPEFRDLLGRPRLLNAFYEYLVGDQVPEEDARDNMIASPPSGFAAETMPAGNNDSKGHNQTATFPIAEIDEFLGDYIEESGDLLSADDSPEVLYPYRNLGANLRAIIERVWELEMNRRGTPANGYTGSQEDEIEKARLKFRELVWQMDWKKRTFPTNSGKRPNLPKNARRINERLGFIETCKRKSHKESEIIPRLLFYYWPAEYAYYEYYQSEKNIAWQDYRKLFNHFCSKDQKAAQTTWRFLIDILDAEGKRPVPY